MATIQNILLDRMILMSLTLNSSSAELPDAASSPSWRSSLRSMTQNVRKQIRPISRNAVQRNTGLTTCVGMNANSAESAIAGDIVNMANTPMRAIAISNPMASAISLPLNHLAMARETVIPAISQPQPKIMNPSEAIFALAGMDVHHESSHASRPLPMNQSLTP
jgi:hypothetical protein